MRRSLGPESARSRGRRIAILLLILLLIALPLYLWPLRGSGTGLPGAASALSGTPRDPRDPAALAHLPADVWDELMGAGQAGGKGKPAHRPGNLTRMAQLEEISGAGPFPIGPGGVSLPGSRDTLPWPASALHGDGGDQSTGTNDPPPAPVQFLSVPAGGEGTGSNGSGGGGSYSAIPNNFGPFGGGGAGGPGGGAPLLIGGDPGDPNAPEPTPEPTTILLVGSNLALLGGVAWRRLRAMKGRQPIG